MGDFKTVHEFMVVNCLIYPVILEVDFLQKNALTLDFTSTPISAYHGGTMSSPQVEALWNAGQHAKSKCCTAAVVSDESPLDD